MVFRVEGEKAISTPECYFRVNNVRMQPQSKDRNPDLANGRDVKSILYYSGHTQHSCARDGWLMLSSICLSASQLKAKLASVFFETDSWPPGGMCMSGYIRDEVRPLQEIQPGKM